MTRPGPSGCRKLAPRTLPCRSTARPILPGAEPAPVLDTPNLWGVTWWCSHDVSRKLADFPELEYTLGLLDSDRRPKPAGLRLAELIAAEKANPTPVIQRGTALSFDPGTRQRALAVPWPTPPVSCSRPGWSWRGRGEAHPGAGVHGERRRLPRRPRHHRRARCAVVRLTAHSKKPRPTPGLFCSPAPGHPSRRVYRGVGSHQSMRCTGSTSLLCSHRGRK